jgi:hypothetical protein
MVNTTFSLSDKTQEIPMAKPQVSRNEPQKAPYVTPTIRTIEVSEIEKRGLMGLLGRPQAPDKKAKAAVTPNHPT